MPNERILRDAEDRFRFAFEHAAIGMALSTLEGRYFKVNTAMANFLGRSADDLLELNWQDVTEPDDLESQARGVARAVERAEESVQREKRYVRPDGTIVWGLLTVTAIRDDTTAEPLYLFAQIFDITDLRSAETERRELLARQAALGVEMELLISSTELGVIGIDSEGRCTFINRAAASMLGYEPAELIGQTLHDLVHHTKADGTPYPLDECPITQSFRTGVGRHIENEVMWRKNGTSVPVEYRAYPTMIEGHATGTVITVADISERSERERSQAEAFADQVDTARRLRELNDVKDAFLAAASHDLRSPLTIIIGAASVLSMTPDTNTPDMRELVRAISRAADRQHRLLSDLLDLDRLSRGAITAHRVTVKVPQTVLQAISNVSAEGRSIDAKVDAETAYVDQMMLERILENLVGNACKYTPDDTPVEVRAWLQDGDLEVAVADRGRGVPDDAKERIFLPHERGVETTAAGSGIGLYLVGQFVRLHGGRAWVEDRDGGGAVFRVTLPAQ
jgi:PAS domain S-box-containing protein